MAFDIGDKRIGVASSDPFGEYAMPGETYFRSGNYEADLNALIKIVKDKGAGEVVCGLPVNFDGTESVQTEKTRKTVEDLRARLNVPVYTEDERLTTYEARETQKQGGLKRGEGKKSLDSIAAAYILDGYLARRKKEQAKRSENMKETNEEEILEEDNLIELEGAYRMIVGL